MRRRLPLLIALVGGAGILAAVALAPRTSTATGVVVAVEATSLTNVTGFTIRGSDGRTRRFAVGALQNRVEFPPGHLVEHIASGVPVVVTYRDENGIPTAIRLVDEPLPSPRPTTSSDGPT